MIGILEAILRAWGARVDREALATAYAAVSVSSSDTRQWLLGRALPYTDDAAGRFPGEEELARSARAIIEAARSGAGWVGAAGSFAGWPGIAPELAITLVQSLRLAQRLAIVYGFDPETERGGVVVTRAVAAAWELPDITQGPGALRLAELPATVRTQLASVTPSVAAGWLSRAAGRSALGRVIRIVPGLSLTLAVTQARSRIVLLGERMDDVLRRSMDRGSFRFEGERLAVEVRGSGEG